MTRPTLPTHPTLVRQIANSAQSRVTVGVRHFRQINEQNTYRRARVRALARGLKYVSDVSDVSDMYLTY